MLLDQLLRAMEVRAHEFALCSLKFHEQHWFESSDLASIHYVLDGRGTLKLTSGQVIDLHPHLFLILPPDVGFEVASAQTNRQMNPVFGQICHTVPEGWQRVGKGNDQECGLLLLCGKVETYYGGAVNLLNLMENPLKADFREDQAIMQHFDGLIEDLAKGRPGHIAMAENLLQRCFMMILQQECGGPTCHMPWLKALNDPRLFKILQVMMADKQGTHSVESLAEIAGMSRASFSAHFNQAFGKSPMAFYNEIRLREAAKTLKATDWPIKRIVQHLGYASRSHFETSFKKFKGVSPTEYRKKRLLPF